MSGELTFDTMESLQLYQRLSPKLYTSLQRRKFINQKLLELTKCSDRHWDCHYGVKCRIDYRRLTILFYDLQKAINWVYFEEETYLSVARICACLVEFLGRWLLCLVFLCALPSGKIASGGLPVLWGICKYSVPSQHWQPSCSLHTCSRSQSSFQHQ